MSRKLEIPNIDHIIELYNSGMSMNQLQNKFGIPRITLTRRFESLNVYTRTQSESETLKWSKMDETTRKRQVQKAHQSSKGRYISTAEKIKRAKSAFENTSRKGIYETELTNAFIDKGFVAINQFNFGIYNIDIAFHELPIFVEIQTSGHHLLRQPKILKRTKHILNSKKLLIYVIIDQSNKPITIDLICDKIISYINIISLDKSILGKYVMIGRDGQSLPVTCYDFDGFTRIE